MTSREKDMGDGAAILQSLGKQKDLERKMETIDNQIMDFTSNAVITPE